MTVAITDNRTEVDQADSLTGWSSPVVGEALNLFTADPNPVEDSGCIGMSVGIQTSDLVFTITSADLTDTLVYVWILANGTMDTLVNGGIALILGDGTDEIGYHLAGSDVAAFRHSAGPVGWQCLVLDTSQLPANATALAGVIANLTLTTITQIGAMYKTLSKALGGSSNCFTDIIRYGNGGITITAGTSGAPGRFSEIAVEDRSSTTQQAYGIIRELGEGLFGVQGPLLFGTSGGTAATFFADTNVVVQFEDRNLGTDKYFITIQGNATGSTTFRLGLLAGTTGGTDGCTITIPVGVGGTFTASDADLQFVLLYGSTFSGFSSGMFFSVDATNAPNHEIFACLFTANGQINPGLTQFKNNSIVGAVLVQNLDGAIVFPTADADIEDLSFQIGVEGHAIRQEDIGTFAHRDIFYAGYSASLVGATFDTETGVNGGTEVITTDAAHLFTTGEPVILNDDGGIETIGLTEGTTYYARALTGTTISLHTSAADAGTDTARVDLTASGGGAGETQHLYSGNAAIVNDSGGLVTINVVRGDTPAYRNVGASTTVVNNNVQVSLTGMRENTEIRVYAAGTSTPELAGIENATVGTVDDRSFAFTLAAGLSVDIRIFAVAYEPADIVGFTMVETTIPIQQRFDRTYLNP